MIILYSDLLLDYKYNLIKNLQLWLHYDSFINKIYDWDYDYDYSILVIGYNRLRLHDYNYLKSGSNVVQII